MEKFRNESLLIVGDGMILIIVVVEVIGILFGVFVGELLNDGV